MEIIKYIKNFAKRNKEIILATLEGSRVNPHAKKDKYQDYDISFFMYSKDINIFLGLDSKQSLNDITEIPCCIKELENSPFLRKILMAQMPESMEFYPPDLPNGWVSFLLLFESGVRLDLTFIPLEDLELYYTIEPLSKVLVDKNKLFTHTIPKIPFSITHLSQRSFDDVCNEFYFTYSALQKALAREQFILANHLLDSMRKALLVMLSFKVGLERGFELWLGKENTRILHYLSKKEVKVVRLSYRTDNLKHITRSAVELESFFRKIIKYICKKNNYKNKHYNKYILKYYKAFK